MPTFKHRQSGSFVSGVTKVKTSEIIIERNEDNSGSVATISKGTSTWDELKNRVTQFQGYNVSGGVNTGSSSLATTSGSNDYWFLLGMSFSEFDLSPLGGISSNDITNVILRYTLTSNSVNANRVKTFSVYTHSYTTLSSSTWRVVDSSTTALGTVTIDTPSNFVRDVTINKSNLSGDYLRIVTIHDLLRENSPSPNSGGVNSNIADGSPVLIVSGNFGQFVPVNLGVI